MTRVEKYFKRDDGSEVVLVLIGHLSVFHDDTELTMFAKRLKKGESDWTYHYPPTKGCAQMRKMSVDEYLKRGWGSIVRPNEVLKASIELNKLLRGN